MRRMVTKMLVLTLALGLCACKGSSGPDAGAGGESPGGGDQPGNVSEAPAKAGDDGEVSLTIGTWSEVANTAAWLLRSGQDKAEWVWTIYEPLFTVGEDGEVVPYLAKELVTNAEDKTYTVILREDVMFSDGSKLDGDVLLWNFENFKENSTMSSTHFGSVDHFEKTGDNTVVIHMKDWSSQIPYSLCSVAGLMYSKKAFDENGYDYCTQNAVGTGPYLLENWEMDASKEFRLREDYWNKEKQAQV